MTSSDASSEEDILTYSLGSEEEYKPQETPLPAKAGDRDRSRSIWRLLAPPGPRLTKKFRPVLEGRGIGGAASSPGGHSRSEDHMRSFSSTTARAGMRSMSFQQDRHQVAIEPGGKGVFHEPKHDADPGGARHQQLTSALGRPASGRTVPITNALQSAAESVVSLVVYEEKDEAEAELSRRGLKRTTTR